MSNDGPDFPSDAELVELTLDGSPRAFGELVKRHQKLIAGVARRFGTTGMEASDLVQDVFLHAYETVGQLEQPERFAAWLYRLAVNRCVDLRRQSRTRQNATDGLAERMQSNPSDPVVEEVERTELRGIVRGAVDELHDELREVVYLRFYNGLAYEEIAELLEVPLTTVDGRLRRAKAQLMQQLSRRTGL
jgi:RNA polymerase sigma-70 factor, ECF subfamily